MVKLGWTTAGNSHNSILVCLVEFSKVRKKKSEFPTLRLSLLKICTSTCCHFNLKKNMQLTKQTAIPLDHTEPVCVCVQIHPWLYAQTSQESTATAATPTSPVTWNTVSDQHFAASLMTVCVCVCALGIVVLSLNSKLRKYESKFPVWFFFWCWCSVVVQI